MGAKVSFNNLRNMKIRSHGQIYWRKLLDYVLDRLHFSVASGATFLDGCRLLLT